MTPWETAKDVGILHDTCRSPISCMERSFFWSETESGWTIKSPILMISENVVEPRRSFSLADIDFSSWSRIWLNFGPKSIILMKTGAILVDNAMVRNQVAGTDERNVAGERTWDEMMGWRATWSQMDEKRNGMMYAGWRNKVWTMKEQRYWKNWEKNKSRWKRATRWRQMKGVTEIKWREKSGRRRYGRRAKAVRILDTLSPLNGERDWMKMAVRRSKLWTIKE